MKSTSLLYIFWLGTIAAFAQKNLIYDQYGAIIRGDTTRKEIALVFTGHEFADGSEVILATLAKHSVKASFFLTGSFYQNYQFKKNIAALKEKGHYLGPHSDQHLLYCDWKKRDSLLIPQHTFTLDLLNNFERMKAFGIELGTTPYFIPPYEWYNKKVVEWSAGLKLKLVNYSSGTRSTADYTYPEMGDKYVTTELIYQSILEREKKFKNGLNGFILLTHIGTDPRRTDKFYVRLDELIRELKKRGYKMVRIDELLE